MSRPPGLSGEQVIAALHGPASRSFAFAVATTSYGTLTACATVVPVDSGEHVGPGLMSKILADCEMTPEEFGKFV